VYSVTERKPTEDEIRGMAWWNNMTEAQRGTAMQLAKATTAAQAWDHHKLMLEMEAEAAGAAGSSERGQAAQDPKSWVAGYRAGHTGKIPDAPPPGTDALSWSSGVIEGRADKEAGRVRPLTGKPPENSR
jgi:hypothetical protein